MTRLRFLVPLPPLRVGTVLLIGREPMHPVLAEDAMYRRAGDDHLMKPLQIVGDPARAEVVVLAEVQNLAHHLRGRGRGAAFRRPWLVAQAGGPRRVKAALPLVERLAGDAEMATRLRHTTWCGGRPLQHAVAPGHGAQLLRLGHPLSCLGAEA